MQKKKWQRQTHPESHRLRNVEQQKDTHGETDTEMLTTLEMRGWFAAEGVVKEAPGSASVLETVTMLFPASRSLAVPLSARGPTLHFSNAQITQFWHLYSVQSTSHSQPSLAMNFHNKTNIYSLARFSAVCLFFSPHSSIFLPFFASLILWVLKLFRPLLLLLLLLLPTSSFH